MPSTVGSGRFTQRQPEAPNLLYDRDVRTKVFHEGANGLRAVATLRDDSLGPVGFATVHQMSLEVRLTLDSLVITEVTSDMQNHPHGTCPFTLRRMDELVGLSVQKGYFSELSKRYGGNRGCNHLLALAQSIGTVVALSFAATITHEDPTMRNLDAPQWFKQLTERQPRIVNSCVIWHEDGDVVHQVRKAEG